MKISNSIKTFLVFLLLGAAPAQAYIGPGAGFAFFGSFMGIFAAFLLAFFTLLFWPLRFLAVLIRRKFSSRGHQKIKKLVIIGLDGLDPRLVKKFFNEGKLPNFSRLAQEGCFTPLKTTTPSISPVAWSTFATGVNPAKHNIYDFLTRNRQTYLPELSSTYIGKVKTLNLGQYRIPLGKPEIRLLRKGKPFWTALGEKGISSSILRVPITFPPEKFSGRMLCAMCVPDLRGTQGSFTYFCTHEEKDKTTGGERILLKKKGKECIAQIPGPENPIREGVLKLLLKIKPLSKDEAVLKLDGQKISLKTGVYSDWIKIGFKAGPGITVTGIVRFLLNSTEPELSLYMTPININPEKPALPISHPSSYGVYLSKLLGYYATLGLAEDTWALNERVIDEQSFLDQAYNIHHEREEMLFNELDKLREGVVACVFDITDRIQHMFWRYLEEDHPANRGKDTTLHKGAIEKLYSDMDEMIGRVKEKLDRDTILIIMSDHGFTSFKRGVNLNSWLHQNGYLALKEGETGGDYFQGVDWAKTKAFSLGLGGIFLNLKGREKQGTVNPGEEEKAMKKELIDKLTGLEDPASGEIAIKNVYDSAELYNGPYRENAPDLLVGYNHGYRTSWESVTGGMAEEVFSDNTKSWSGDHCVDSQLVPGVFFCNRKMEEDHPDIRDIAPTVLDLFGVEIPSFYEGKPLFKDVQSFD